MNEVPDLLDRGPRLKRLALSLLVGVAVGVLVGTLCYTLAGRDTTPAASYPYDGGHAARAWKFVFYMAGGAGAASFVIALRVLGWRAKKLASRPAQARVVRG